MPYRSLNAESLIATLETLTARIQERFPARGIHNVCAELLETARNDAARAAELERPVYWVRFSVGAVIAAAAAALAWALWTIKTPEVDAGEIGGFEGIEALINIAILAGAAIWFLLNLETRVKRERILSDLHELRSIAHVIDMHQLTKDPTRVLGEGPGTKSSPERTMNAFELGRYLDYCAEMLSLTGKLAALYLRTSRDEVVIQAVNEIEELTTNLTGKIWQKIMILRQDHG